MPHIGSTLALGLAALSSSGWRCAVGAQEAEADNRGLALEAQISRGASLLENNDPSALQVLAEASRSSLALLAASGGQSLLLAPPERVPQMGPVGEAAARAAQAHLLWGQAADRFAQRDLAITALARAYRLAGPNRLNTNRTSRDAVLFLNRLNREGLPQFAADDTLDTLSSLGLWKPRRWSFTLPASLSRPDSLPAPAARATNNGNVEILITQGKLFPPTVGAEGAGVDKAVVAPLYRGLPGESLPSVLKLGYMIAGFERETSGPNRGLWRLAARVFYAHPLFTRANRDDRPRAEALCAQFLRLRALHRAATGLENPYAREGVTDIWLSEVSALWPDDEDDIELTELRGARMPKVNTKLAPNAQPTQVEETPLSMPWLAAGQMTGAPGDILFFKVGQPRAEAEWLRELAHEYGHIVLAPTAFFRPPLEPFGNGEVGEALAMLWVASNAAPFEVASILRSPPPPPLPTLASTRGGRPAHPAPVFNPSPEALRLMALGHVAQNALPALRLWNEQGPGSRLRADGTRYGLQYLAGLNVWIERVYGGRVLGASHRPSVQRSAFSWSSNARISATSTLAILQGFENTMRNALPANEAPARVPVWLPGALEKLPPSLPASQLANRSALSVRSSQSISTLLFVPPQARRLHIELRSERRPLAASALRAVGWKSRAVAPALRESSGALEVEVAGRGGWRRFIWTTGAPVTLSSAWFSR
jgi:hypothetical protein